MQTRPHSIFASAASQKKAGKLTVITRYPENKPLPQIAEHLISDENINTIIKWEKRLYRMIWNNGLTDAEKEGWLTVGIVIFIHAAVGLDLINHIESEKDISTPHSKIVLHTFHLWLLSLFIFLFPYITKGIGNFVGKDKLTKDDRKAISTITNIDVSGFTAKEIHALLNQKRRHQATLISRQPSPHSDFLQYCGFHQYLNLLEQDLDAQPKERVWVKNTACAFELLCWMLNVSALVIHLGITPVPKHDALTTSLSGFAFYYLARVLHLCKLENKKLTQIFNPETVKLLGALNPDKPVSRERVQSALWNVRAVCAKPLSDSLRLRLIKFLPAPEVRAAQLNSAQQELAFKMT